MKKITDYLKQPNFAQLEESVLTHWDDVDAFQKSVDQRPENNPYIFYDGPPFATGLPHYGHFLASIIKDVVPRYWTMKGFRVERVWGWDCHGVPIENMIEKELGLKGGKKGIEEMGIGAFNASCRSAIMRFDKEWERIIKRIGRWVDFKHSYKTMDNTYMESVWWAFKQLYDKGLVYEGRKVILYCPRCATPLSNFEIAMDNSYKDLVGPSTTYKYKVVEEKDTFLLAWSTTPWNKLATPALAVNPTYEYVKVKQDGEFYILAKNTLKMLKPSPYEVVETYKGKDLEKFTFEMHYSFYPLKEGEKNGVVIADEYVTEAEGTGIVTLAVYGEDDYRVMTKHHIQMIEHVDGEGILKPEVKPWAGMFMLKVNPLVNEDLQKRGLVYHNEDRTHSVPVCYRCETRLYHAPVPAWFINVSKLKPDLLANNEDIHWYPGYLKHGRFGKGLETAPDWNISRSRYWGTPMPIWRSEDGTLRMIGSLEELKQWAVDPSAVENLTDIHREFLDDLEVWVDDQKTVKGTRIPEVFDCWVESGSMPYASIHYPFENKQKFEARYPAQFISEYIAQTRAWFYTLHVLSVGLFGKPAFQNAVTTGTILAEDGTKMSKSKKNYPDPTLVVDKYGVDSLRLYLMSSPVMKADNLNFSEKSVDEIRKKVFGIWWNVFAFYKIYADQSHDCSFPEEKKVTDPLDRWIVSKTMQLTKDVTKAMDAYDVVTSSRLMMEFAADLSTWYLRESRERVKDTKNNAVSSQVFGAVLKQYALLFAPIVPFFSEVVYQNLVQDPKESVHLEDWPSFDEKRIKPELETGMANIRQAAEKSHAQRKEHNIKVRQPLALVRVVAPTVPDESLFDVLKKEINVENVEWVKGESLEVVVTLDTVITEDLKKKGEMRDVMRTIQDLRKASGVGFSEKVVIQLPSWPEQYEEEIKAKTLVSKLVRGDEAKLIQ